MEGRLGILIALAVLMAAASARADVCYIDVSRLTPQCVGGDLTADNFVDGCREFTCTNGTSGMLVKACDEPAASTNPTYFELYKLSAVGQQMDLCLAGTCLNGNGFARSQNYSACTPQNTSAAQVQFIRSVPNEFGIPNRLNISVDQNALFFCNASFVPAEFHWDFGDGRTAVKNFSTVKSTDFWNYYYHTYLNNGTYTVTCTAINGTQVAQGQATVTIRTDATPQEIAATLPAKDTDVFNPYVFRPVAQQINGSTYRVGSYSIGLPRAPDNSGQESGWNVNFPLVSNIIGTGSNIMTLTFPQPGTYTFTPTPGINDGMLAPDLYNTGVFVRGCSSIYTTCMSSSGFTNITVPNLGTRTTFGIQAVQVAPNTYNISCTNYGTDTGLGGRLDLGDATFISYNPGQSVTHTYAQQGIHQITCFQAVEPSASIEYTYTLALNVTNTTPSPPPNQSACYSNMKDIPPDCSGARLVQDTVLANGCRVVACVSGQSGLQILACNKPGDNSPQRFEMYRQTAGGSPAFQVCLAGTCIGSNGYAASPGFPVCTGNITPQPNATCFSSINNLPAQCSGTLTSDSIGSDGCRYLACASSQGSTSAKACDKPGSSNAQYFELYKLSSTGTPPQLCLDGACISGDGYARSGNYPLCTGQTTNQTNQSNQSNQTHGCSYNVRQLPISCGGGAISAYDLGGGCAQVICAGSAGSMQALVCDKPDGSAAPVMYEAYKQWQTGTGITALCIGNACLKDNGFASGTYPLCN